MASGIKHRGSEMKKFLIFLICIFSVSVIYAENLVYNFHFTKKSENYLGFCDSTGAEETEFYFIPSVNETSVNETEEVYELTLGVKYNIYDSSYSLQLVFTSGIAASEGTGGYMLSLIDIDDSGNSVLSNEIGLNYSVKVDDVESIAIDALEIDKALSLARRTITIDSKTEDATRNNESNGMKTKEVTLTLKAPYLDNSQTGRAFSSGVYAGNIILRLESNS